MEYRYSLRKGSRKSECPNCKKNTFKPYIETATGKEAGSKYGVCDRINSCGYKLYPKFDKNDDWRPTPQPYIPPKPIEYIPIETVEATFNDYRNNVFFQYLRTTFGAQVATELVEKYNIGTAKHGGTIFWQEDTLKRFRTAKVMYYNTNGKRDKTRASWFVHKKIREDFNFQQCFFGLHLVDGTKPVALCESEKTAIMMSVYMPEYVWVSSGGSEMLNAQRLCELKRLDKVFPDGSQWEKWQNKTKHFNPQMDLSVEKAIAEGLIEEGSDILDLIQINL